MGRKKTTSEPAQNTGYCGYVDFRTKTSMPIRDMHRDGEVFCVVDVYGWTGREVTIIPGGSDPFHAAVRRLGLDPARYQAVLWDAQA